MSRTELRSFSRLRRRGVVGSPADRLGRAGLPSGPQQSDRDAVSWQPIRSRTTFGAAPRLGRPVGHRYGLESRHGPGTGIPSVGPPVRTTSAPTSRPGSSSNRAVYRKVTLGMPRRGHRAALGGPRPRSGGAGQHRVSQEDPMAHWRLRPRTRAGEEVYSGRAHPPTARGLSPARHRPPALTRSPSTSLRALWEDQGLIFPSEAGAPLDPSNVRRTVAKVAKAAGIAGNVNPYTARHLAASLRHEAGWIKSPTSSGRAPRRSWSTIANRVHHVVAIAGDTHLLPRSTEPHNPNALMFEQRSTGVWRSKDRHRACPGLLRTRHPRGRQYPNSSVRLSSPYRQEYVCHLAGRPPSK